jgi:hypothetical protein
MNAISLARVSAHSSAKKYAASLVGISQVWNVFKHRHACLLDITNLKFMQILFLASSSLSFAAEIDSLKLNTPVEISLINDTTNIYDDSMALIKHHEFVDVLVDRKTGDTGRLSSLCITRISNDSITFFATTQGMDSERYYSFSIPKKLIKLIKIIDVSSNQRSYKNTPGSAFILTRGMIEIAIIVGVTVGAAFYIIFNASMI